MRAIFVFPPFVESAMSGPHLAGPLLAAICHAEALQASTLDLNIRVTQLLLRAYARPEGTGWLHNAAAKVPRILDTGLALSNPRVARHILRFFRDLIFHTPRTLAELPAFDFEAERPEADTLYEDLVRSEIPADCCVCLTVAFAEQLIEALHLAAIIKRRSPAQPIFLGGSQINLLPQELLAILTGTKLLDVIAVGNGETQIAGLIRTAEAVAGRDTRIMTSGAISRQQLNELPRPVFVDVDLYIGKLNIPVIVTKGCFWGECSFCDYVKLSDIGGLKYIGRAPEIVLHEMEELAALYPVSKFILISDAVPPAWFAKFSEAATKRGFDGRTWSYMLHHTVLNTAFFEQIRKAGSRAINFGTESFSDEVLKVMRKQASSEIAIRNIEDAHRAGLSSVVNIIPDYPLAEFSDVLRTHDVLHDLRKKIEVINPQAFDVTADTDVAKRPEAYGLTPITGAYERSAHGFHSMVHKRVRGLSMVERNAAIDMMKRLAVGHKVDRRNDFRPVSALKSGDRLMLDRSFYTTANTASLTSLGATLQLNASTREIVAHLRTLPASEQGSPETRAEWHTALSEATDAPQAALSWLYENGFLYRAQQKPITTEFP